MVRLRRPARKEAAPPPPAPAYGWPEADTPDGGPAREALPPLQVDAPYEAPPHLHDHGPQPSLPPFEAGVTAPPPRPGGVPPGFTPPDGLLGIARTRKPEDDDVAVGRRHRHPR